MSGVRSGPASRCQGCIPGERLAPLPGVDTAGQTIGFLLTARRDAAAALRFFRKAIRHHGEPEVVTTDKSGANTAALDTFNVDKPEEETITIRQNKYLNNLIEQDHRNIKRRIKLVTGLNRFGGHRRCWPASN